MIKNLSILILGIFIGVAGTVVFSISKIEENESAQMMREAENGGEIIVTPEIDYDKLYDHLVEEQKPKSEEEKYWFDEELDKLQSEAQKQDAKMKAEGEDAASLFEQFSGTTEKK